MSSAHLSPELLTRAALGSPNPETAAHLAACTGCRAEAEQLRDAAGTLRATTLSDSRIETPECLDELVVAEFVDGVLTGETRDRAVAHLLECGRCRALVKATSEVASGEREPAVAAARGSHVRRWALPLGLAAAAAFALILLPAPDQGGHREPPLSSVVAPVPLHPAANDRVTRVGRFVWSSVPGAERYRLRVYDAAGTVLLDTETVDTSAALPDSIALSAGVSYFWRIEAQTDWQRWSASNLVEFRLQ